MLVHWRVSARPPHLVALPDGSFADVPQPADAGSHVPLKDATDTPRLLSSPNRRSIEIQSARLGMPPAKSSPLRMPFVAIAGKRAGMMCPSGSLYAASFILR